MRAMLTSSLLHTKRELVSRPLVALALLVVCLAVTFGLRTVRQLKLTGSTGFHGLSGRPGSIEWIGGVLFVAALAMAAGAPIAELAGIVGPLFPVPPWLFALGITIVLIGTALTYWAQMAMGRSWRIGVDAAEKTALVTNGPFRWVRNPIFSFLLLTMAGFALLLPNALAIAGWVSLLVAIELQVRLVEEPYLLRAHGAPYAQYARRVGRFVPATGRFAASTKSP